MISCRLYIHEQKVLRNSIGSKLTRLSKVLKWTSNFSNNEWDPSPRRVDNEGHKSSPEKSLKRDPSLDPASVTVSKISNPEANFCKKDSEAEKMRVKAY